VDYSREANLSVYQQGLRWMVSISLGRPTTVFAFVFVYQQGFKEDAVHQVYQQDLRRMVCISLGKPIVVMPARLEEEGVYFSQEAHSLSTSKI
jgi:hypothetical protein